MIHFIVATHGPLAAALLEMGVEPGDRVAAWMPNVPDTIVVMLLAEPFFKTFTTKGIADTSTSTEALLGLSAETREAVDALVDKALATGGSEGNATQDHGFMYSRSFQDPDGHIWEIIWMNPENIEG